MEALNEIFITNTHHLSKRTALHTYTLSWRVNEDKKKSEEAVAITGWNDVNSYMAFAALPGFQDFTRIKDHMEANEIKHARVIDL